MNGISLGGIRNHPSDIATCVLALIVVLSAPVLSLQGETDYIPAALSVWGGPFGFGKTPVDFCWTLLSIFTSLCFVSPGVLIV